MGFELQYTDQHGRRVSQQQWIEGIKDQAIHNALLGVEQDVHREVAALRCPEHGRTPTIRTKIVGNRLQSEITGCCETIRTRAQQIATRQA